MRTWMDRLILMSFQAWGVPSPLLPADRTLALARGRDVVFSLAAVVLVSLTYLGAHLHFGVVLPLPLAAWAIVYLASLWLVAWYLGSIVKAAVLVRDLRDAR